MNICSFGYMSVAGNKRQHMGIYISQEAFNWMPLLTGQNMKILNPYIKTIYVYILPLFDQVTVFEGNIV